MRPSAKLQLLTCLMVYVSCTHAIMVKFGTKLGPIEPPTPEPSIAPPLPYRVPAPVWEEGSNDTPDPNAQWRPRLFIPQPRYTHVIYTAPAPHVQPFSNAQRFVNSYLTKHEPVPAQPIEHYFTPSQVLSSQSLPGFGLTYFVPAYVKDLEERKDEKRQEDAKHNQIENNEIASQGSDSASDLQWKYEKDATKRVIRNTQEGIAAPYVYQWPAYVPPRHHQ